MTTGYLLLTLIPGVLIAIIAATPGILAYRNERIRRLKEQRDQEAASYGQVSVDFARTAFDALRQEVDTLRRERIGWSTQVDLLQLEVVKMTDARLSWYVERARLLDKVQELTNELAALRAMLASHGVVPSAPEPGPENN